MEAMMHKALHSPQTEPQSVPTINSPHRLQQLAKGVRAVVTGILVSMSSVGTVEAGEPAPNSLPTVKIGKLVIVGGGILPPGIGDDFMELAGGENANLVVIPTASIDADDPQKTPLDFCRHAARTKTVQLLHTRDRAVANTSEFVLPLKNANAVWISGGKQGKVAEAYVGTSVEEELWGVLKRGGVIGGTSAGAAVMSRIMIAGGREEPEIQTGFGFLYGRPIVEQHFNTKPRTERFHRALHQHSDHYGLAFDEGTAGFVDLESGRLRVKGTGNVHIRMPSTYGGTDMGRILRDGDETIWPPNMEESIIAPTVTLSQ